MENTTYYNITKTYVRIALHIGVGIHLLHPIRDAMRIVFPVRYDEKIIKEAEPSVSAALAILFKNSFVHIGSI